MAVRGPEIDRDKIGRVVNDRGAYLRLRSGRVGRHNGQTARTFTAVFGSVKVGQRVGDVVDYVARDGDFSGRSDLEYVAGAPDKLEAAAQAIDAGAVKRRGPTAERVLVKLTYELPAELSEVQRRLLASKEVVQWRKRGHEAVAAVHGRGEVQPHMHVLVTARPVQETGGGWVVDRSTRLMAGAAARSEVRAERRRIADQVNQVLDRHQIDAPRFFAGRDAAMDRPGIEGRTAKRRVPMAVYMAGVREISPDMAAQVREIHERERALAALRRKARTGRPGVHQLRAQRDIEEGDRIAAELRADRLERERDAARAEAAAARRARDEQTPATAKQVAAAMRVLHEQGKPFPDDQLLTVAWVGDVMAMARKARQKPEEPVRATAPAQPSKFAQKPEKRPGGRGSGGIGD